MLVLAGDIGGTKTLLQVVDVYQGQNNVLAERSFESARYATFDEVLALFLELLNTNTRQSIQSVCIAVAGPVYESVKGQTAQVTNLPWILKSIELSSVFNNVPVSLVNDFVAVCHGIKSLKENDIRVLQEGKPHSLKAHQVVLGAGTGLGMGQIVSYGDEYCILPSEGGHADFAPGSLIQVELLNYLLKNGEKVSIESVCSGVGLFNIYCFIRDLEPEKESLELSEMIKNSDPAAAITFFAKEHKDILAEKSLKLFVEIYGAIAGNFAITTLPFGGVYLAGGIAPKIADWICSGEFIQAFNNKNKMASLLVNIPVRLILNSHVGLSGAVYVAGQH